MHRASPLGSQPQKYAQSTFLQPDTNASVGAATADADICAHRGLDGFTIRTAPGQQRASRDQKHHLNDTHHTSAFHRLIWARTWSGAVPP